MEGGGSHGRERRAESAECVQTIKVVFGRALTAPLPCLGELHPLLPSLEQTSRIRYSATGCEVCLFTSPDSANALVPDSLFKQRPWPRGSQILPLETRLDYLDMQLRSHPLFLSLYNLQDLHVRPLKTACVLVRIGRSELIRGQASIDGISVRPRSSFNRTTSSQFIATFVVNNREYNLLATSLLFWTVDVLVPAVFQSILRSNVVVCLFAVCSLSRFICGTTL